VRLIQQAGEQYEFELSSREYALLVQVLSLYPVIPAGYQSLSKSAVAEDPNQRLLDDALNETRAHNAIAVQNLLADPNKLTHSESECRLRLSPGELDWLLQVLNDVRVGSWLRLGSPEKPLEGLTAENAVHYWALEIAGYFQGGFLEMFDG
jgi:hypothetical protein